jgi:hypothetical protein
LRFWIDSLSAKNIIVKNNAAIDTIKRFCFEGSMFQCLRIYYGDTLTIIHSNKYYQKSAIKGLEIAGCRPSICVLQFYDDKGKQISNIEYKALLKKKSKWSYKLFNRK